LYRKEQDIFVRKNEKTITFSWIFFPNLYTSSQASFYLVWKVMAHKKAAGSVKNLKDSQPKYRWVKVFGGQPVVAGNIIIRQKGSKYECGKNTYEAADFSILAKADGVVAFKKKNFKKFNGRTYLKTVVEVVPAEDIKSKKEAAKKVEKPVAEKKAPAKKTTKKVEKPAAEKKAPAKKTTTVKKVSTKKVSKEEKSE